MPLSVGDKLGPYEIIGLIGAGGMGEVYRAKDTKLKRDVALKVLPEIFARDAERMARFQREAEVLASLNHPNIAQIYGVEGRALIMELVEGEMLAGPQPLETVLSYARQIAGALEAAHEKGILHRDLKPANVMITQAGIVKLLDFGLAKAMDDPVASGDASNSPTLTMSPTLAGMILGTAAYMSPEQAHGKAADRRADIWSFGAVLYEVLAGKQAFLGESVSDILASVLKLEPDWDALPAGTPPEIRKLMRQCLRKDRTRRLQAIGDARLAIEEYLADPTGTMDVPRQADIRSPRLHRFTWLGIAAMTLIAAAAGFGWWRSTRPVDHPLIRLSVDLGAGSETGARSTAAISPDGSRIVFPIRGPSGKQQLATRLLDQATPTLLSGTENGFDPFFSPDGQWIGFGADGKLKKVSVLGGAALTLCDAPALRGASWGEDGNIVATLNSTTNTGLSRVPAAGGVSQPLTKPVERGEQSHRSPQVLPGGDAILFTGHNSTAGWDNANIEVLSLKTSQIKILVRGGYFGRYLPSNGSNGHLVFIREGVLFGVPFDLGRLEVRGTPSPLLQDIAGDPATAGGQLDVSKTGTMVYLSGKPGGSAWSAVWLDSSGKTQPLLPKPGNYYNPRLSPDGNWLALSVVAGKGNDLYVYDWRHDTMPRLTFNSLSNRDPAWTPDGKHITFDSSEGLLWIRADGGGEAQPLFPTKNPVLPFSFSPDGKRLVYIEQNPETRWDIWTLPLDLSDPEHPKPGKPEVFLRTPADEFYPMLSPDGRWMAYSSDESGTVEVYVRPFPGPGGKWQISTGGGGVPMWSRDGHDLFYATRDDHIMVTGYTAKSDSFSYSKPRLWTDKQIFNSGRRYFDLAPDGKRFAVFLRADASEDKQSSAHVIFLLNFFDEVRRRIPVEK